MSSVPPTPQEQPSQQAPLGGWPGAVAALVRVINGMTNEKILLVTVIAVLVYATYTNINSQHEREAMSARSSDEARERDRRHCDDREDRIRKDAQLEQERMRAWYTQMADAQRRFEGEERTKDRLAVTDLTKAVLRKQEKENARLPLLHRAFHDDDGPGSTRRPALPVVQPANDLTRTS